jgi:DNA-binding MurR/RpiR family transcriptional regulator
VTIYADRIAKVSETAALTFGRVLGYAMAHELGHVLLHSVAHEDIGLMKSVWSRFDWQRAAVSVIPFNPRQSRQIVTAIQESRSRQMAGVSLTKNR